jgi:hypothetical protein
MEVENKTFGEVSEFKLKRVTKGSMGQVKGQGGQEQVP